MGELQIRFSVHIESEKILFTHINDLVNHDVRQLIWQKITDCDLKMKEAAILHLLNEKIGISQTTNLQVAFTDMQREPPFYG
ncbi:hypothetical protein ACQKL5_16310 [Peribacillus sp. NPDC097675]|uniref:hypothetical protein n=1 Tax=Peribacillus sp. NPDC097675 TaxID=3390618 RepID=UPI003CFC96B5